MAEKIRFIEKNYQPTKEIVQLFMGDDAWQHLMRFEEMLRTQYDLNREIK